MYNLYDIENVDQIMTFEIEGLDEDMNFKSKEDFYWWEKLADAFYYLGKLGKEIDYDYILDLNNVMDIADTIKNLKKDDLEVYQVHEAEYENNVDITINNGIVLTVPYFDKEGNEIYLHQAQDMYTAEELEQDLWDDPVYLGHIYNHIKERGE